jgi:hypothetical protein
MEKLLLITLLIGVPANFFIFVGNVTGGNIWVRAIVKTLVAMYLLLATIIVLNFYKII